MPHARRDSSHGAVAGGDTYVFEGEQPYSWSIDAKELRWYVSKGRILGL